ncbi:MAG: A24 family peptidase [Phycisphaerales bacterium]|nr:A24 family peptidase [Phycisphaerales bacterium]
MTFPLLIASTIFLFLTGTCVGSFLNVVIWRLPNYGREVLFQNQRGPLTLNWPPSHCPVCDAPIKWYHNVPVLAWFFLKAKCANCKTHIPVRYPLVELALGVVFAGYFLASSVGHWSPFPFIDLREPAQACAFVLHLIFIAALLAASAIDIDLFIIPLSIPWFLIILGLLATPFINHPVIWQLPLPPSDSWHFARSILGAGVGLALANLLLALKILPRSFSEPREEARSQKPEARREEPEAESSNFECRVSNVPPLPKLTHFFPSIIASLVLVLLCVFAWFTFSNKAASLITVCSGIFIFLIGVLPRDPDQTDVTDEVVEEIAHPQVRRETLKELLFLAVPLVCAFIACFIPINIPPSPCMARFLGCLLGILIGGGVVWFIRVLGSLAFNKEAMGMGDAHLMAGVGAIVGPWLVVFAFFGAAFLGLAWAIVLLFQKKPHVLPFGPWLSIASILALLVGHSLIAAYVALFIP